MKVITYAADRLFPNSLRWQKRFENAVTVGKLRVKCYIGGKIKIFIADEDLFLKVSKKLNLMSGYYNGCEQAWVLTINK